MATAARHTQQYLGPRLVERKDEYRTGADIQIENGQWFKVHNDIAEALAKSDLNGLELRLLWHLLRMTYGWQRKEVDLSYNQFASATNSTRRTVIRYLNALQEKNVIESLDNGQRETRTWWFNKYHERWNLNGDQTAPSDQTATTPSDQLGTTDGDQTATTPSDQLVTQYKDKDKDKGKKDKDNNNSGRRRRDLDPEYGIICERYEQEIGMLTEVVSQSLSDLLDEYKSHRLICDAIGVAVKANKRKLSYVEGVLKNWRAEGRQEQPTPQPEKPVFMGPATDNPWRD